MPPSTHLQTHAYALASELGLVIEMSVVWCRLGRMAYSWMFVVVLGVSFHLRVIIDDQIKSFMMRCSTIKFFSELFLL